MQFKRLKVFQTVIIYHISLCIKCEVHQLLYEPCQYLYEMHFFSYELCFGNIR